MQRNKGTKNISEIESLTTDSSKIMNSLADVMNRFNVKRHISVFDVLKSKGLAVSSLISMLLILPFYGIASINQLVRCGLNHLDFDGAKDVYYDIKNNEFIDWRKLLMLHAKRFIYLINSSIEYNEARTSALIFDDTLLEKTGKKIERVSYVNDHVSGRFILGYKLLVCGFWDGNSFIPLDFSLHRERGRKHDEFIKADASAQKAYIRNQKTVTALNLQIDKQAQRVSKCAEKYSNKSRVINELSYNNAKIKLDKLSAHLVEAQKQLALSKHEKEQTRKELKRYYSKGVLFGLNTKERQAQYKKLVSTKSCGFKRRKETDKTKINSMLDMLGRVVKHGIIPNYVLVDSWFFCFELIDRLQQLKKGVIKLVAMVRINNQTFTTCKDGTQMSLKQILKRNENRAQRCKKLKAQYISVKCFYGKTRVDLFFVRMGQCKTWHLLATTDLDLSFVKIMEIYQIRWSIEVFFKESKQYLNLGACQSKTFDAQIADITLVMMQHIMISYFKRIHYEQSFGGLFAIIKLEVSEMDLITRLIDLFWELVNEMCDVSGIDFIEFQQNAMKDENVLAKFAKLIPERIIDKKAA